jgi:alpha-galactosidase
VKRRSTIRVDARRLPALGNDLLRAASQNDGGFRHDSSIVLRAGDANVALARFAHALAKEMNARVPARIPTGWCSWYYYYTNVTEADVLENVRFLAAHRHSLPIEYIQIDDGYQAGIGDWLVPNEKFPRGMGPLANDIRDAGFSPGIWTAPFLAGENSRLFTDHPSWAVRNIDGSPAVAVRNWGQDCFALDTTHPGAERWLRETFREICEKWSYDYLKIDFLFAAAIAGTRHDKSASPVEAYRRGLELIRDVAGERFILGCGALMGPSVGLVDGMRIGPDVAPWWRYNRPVTPPRERGRPKVGGEPSAENALRNIFTRAWMHSRLWVNDPDCLIARQTRTKLTLPEVQSLATAIALSGGMVLFSDDMTQLSAERLDICSLLLPPLGHRPVVPDLMEESMPSVMRVRIGRGRNTRWLVGAFNWLRKKRPLGVQLPPGRWHVFELWSQRYLGERERNVLVPDVPSHGVALLSLRRTLDRPQLIGSTFHYSMGGPEVAQERWDAANRTLRIALRPVPKERGLLAVHIPSGFRLRDARFAGDAIPAERHGRALIFRFALKQPGRLDLTFASI